LTEAKSSWSLWIQCFICVSVGNPSWSLWSILWSFSAILTNFRRKNWRFWQIFVVKNGDLVKNQQSQSSCTY
jgi:hypothetical protein